MPWNRLIPTKTLTSGRVRTMTHTIEEGPATPRSLVGAHPGHAARAILEARGTPADQFIRELRVGSAWDAYDFLRGATRVTLELAERLAWLLGETPRFWLDLDAASDATAAADSAAVRAEERAATADRLTHLVAAWAAGAPSSVLTTGEVVALVGRLADTIRTPPRARGGTLPPPVVAR